MEGCVFCEVVRGEAPSWRVYEDESTYAFLNIFPASDQIVNSSGAHAQQDVFPLHFHLVPRRPGDGQDVEWSMHPEWRGRFNDMVSKLREAGVPEAAARGKGSDLADLVRGIPYQLLAAGTAYRWTGSSAGGTSWNFPE